MPLTLMLTVMPPVPLPPPPTPSPSSHTQLEKLRRWHCIGRCNNYLPKWWLVIDVYGTAKLRGIDPQLAMCTEVNSFLYYILREIIWGQTMF